MEERERQAEKEGQGEGERECARERERERERARARERVRASEREKGPWRESVVKKKSSSMKRDNAKFFSSVLQCIPACCSVLQCVAMRCSVLQCLQRVAICCSVRRETQRECAQEILVMIRKRVA